MRRPRTKKEQSAQSRERILEAAIHLFAKKGFASTSTQDIAKAARMTPGALYWHFESKEDLLIAVVEELIGRLGSALAEERRAAPGGTPAPEVVRRIVDRVATIVERRLDEILLVGVIAAEATDTMPRVEEALRRAYRGIADMTERLLELSPPGAHPFTAAERRAVAELFPGIYMGGVLHQRLFRRELPLESALPVLKKMLFAALFPSIAAAR